MKGGPPAEAPGSVWPQTPPPPPTVVVLCPRKPAFITETKSYSTGFKKRHFLADAGPASLLIRNRLCTAVDRSNTPRQACAAAAERQRQRIAARMARNRRQLETAPRWRPAAAERPSAPPDSPCLHLLPSPSDLNLNFHPRLPLQPPYVQTPVCMATVLAVLHLSGVPTACFIRGDTS